MSTLQENKYGYVEWNLSEVPTVSRIIALIKSYEHEKKRKGFRD
jgi:hypothetical protein